MTDQHRATPEQWAYMHERTEAGLEMTSCILELRDRIEALEAAQLDKLDRLIALDAADPTPDPAMTELRAASAEAQPGGLVERVARSIERTVDFNPDSYAPEARAAIREVAAAAKERIAPFNPWLRWNDVAQWLEQEAME